MLSKRVPARQDFDARNEVAWPFPAGKASTHIPQEKRPGEPKDPRPRLYHKDGERADRSQYMAAQGYGNAAGTVVPFPGQIPGAMPPR